jgi:hypothetical protein
MADLNGDEANLSEINYEIKNINDTIVIENPSESIGGEIPNRRISTRDIEESLIVPESELKRHKVNSLSRLGEGEKNPIIIPKENLNSFFNRLASVSKFNSQKPRESKLTNELIQVHENNNSNPNPNLMKQSDTTQKKTTKQRDTQMLDARFNVNEILNDQNKLLLTEENILEKSTDSSKENDVLNIKENNHNLSFSMDENIDINFAENNFKNDLKLSQGFDTFDKNSKKPVTSRTPSTNAKNNNLAVNNKLKKIIPIKEVNKPPVITSRNKNVNLLVSGKNSITPKSFNLPNKKTSGLSSLDSSTNTTTKSTLNSFSVTKPVGGAKSKSPTYTKQNLSPNFKTLSTTRPSLSPNFKKQDILNKNKNVSPMNSMVKNKNPVGFITKINPQSNQSSSNNKKDFNVTNFNTKLNETMRNNNTMIPNKSKKDVLNTSSSVYSKKTSDSSKNLSKSFHNRRSSQGVTDRKTSFINTEFNVIEEYDYSKILNELRAIFGEDLEFFDENSNYLILLF